MALNQPRGGKDKFIAHSISTFKTTAPQSFQRRRLSRLEIADANVRPEAVLFLNSAFHTINDLIFSNCYVVKDETKTTSNSMPSTKVRALLINTSKSAHIGYSGFIPSSLGGQIKPIDEIHVMLSLQDSKTAIFKIQPNCPNALPISNAEYAVRPDTATTLHIFCKSLDHLELNVDDMHAKVDITEYFQSLV